MSNLGLYQVMTTLAKKVGGPLNLAGLLVVGGAALGSGTVVGGQKVAKKVKQYRDKKKRTEESAIAYEVHADGKSNEGLVFKVGERFRVLENDGDAVLIEKIGDKQNPYFVSGKFLASISDYAN